MSTVQRTTVLNKIRSRGYWRVEIRPTEFQADRIPQNEDLFRIVEKNSVRLRGWDYPHIDYARPPLRGNDWVGQEFDRDDKIEVWRIYRSGLFTHYFTIHGDWRDHSRHWPPESGSGWEWGRELNYLSTIYSFVEIFEFASRLALSLAGAGQMSVEIDMNGLANRRVISTDDDIAMFEDHTTQASEWKYLWEGSQTDLIAWPRDLAALAAQDFFKRFGLNLSTRVLLILQERMAR